MAKTIKGHGKGVIFKKGVKSLKQWKMKRGTWVKNLKILD
jgi:hypothetical protein